MSPLRRGLTFTLVLLGLSSAGQADIVVLDNGRFLKTSGYRVEGENAHIELEKGGELVLPVLRIDRLIDDEVVLNLPEQGAENRARAEPAEPFFLGFEAEDEQPETPYGEFIFEVSKRRNVNPDLVVAIVRAESAFDSQAVSHKGARGLMQLMPSTSRRLGFPPEELFDAEINIEAGVSYLEILIDRYDDLPLVLAAYNAGETAVRRHNGVPPFRETQEYIRRVYSFLGVAPATASAPGK